jgi:hypothetical protein
MINPTHCIPETIAESSPKLRIKKKAADTELWPAGTNGESHTDGKFYVYNLICTIFA